MTRENFTRVSVVIYMGLHMSIVRQLRVWNGP